MSKIRSVRRRTGAPRQDEGPGTGVALLAGAGLGLATDAVVFALPREQARLLAGAGLAAASGVYLGFAVADGRRSALLVQTGELLGFTALAVLAVQRDSPGLLGVGWLAHVTWDARHYRGRGPTRVRSGYPRSASATTWPSLFRCSPAGSSWRPARAALRRPAPGDRPAPPRSVPRPAAPTAA